MQIVIYIALFQSLLPLLYYWLIRKKIIQDSKPIVPFIYLCFIAGLYEIIFTFQLKINVAVWFYVYDFLAFFSIQYFYYFILKMKYKRMMLLSSILYLFLFLYFVSHHTHLKQLDYIAYLGVLNTLLIIFYSIKWFKKSFLDSEFETLILNPNFYFVSGFILYYAGTIVLFLLVNTIYLNQKELISHFWILNVFFNLVHKTLLLVGIWKLQKQLKK